MELMAGKVHEEPAGADYNVCIKLTLLVDLLHVVLIKYHQKTF
jgi:hypothetical protein